MRVLIAHVAYRERGGEDVVVEHEADLLRAAGHEVRMLVVPSSVFDGIGLPTQVRIALRMGDHRWGRDAIAQAIDEFEPEIVHFHNLYPMLSPGAITAAAHAGCASVQTLHNYRLSCLAGTHFLNGEVCERCSPGRFRQGIVRGCYRGSRLQSASIARGLTAQWRNLMAGTPRVALALTSFMRDKYAAYGLDVERIVVKPNSVATASSMRTWAERAGVIFVGRLSAEKGVLEFVGAWPSEAPALTVVGGGPQEREVRAVAGKNVALTGALDAASVRERLSRARVCVVPSLWYEGLPLVVLEALAEGTLVVTFDHGAFAASDAWPWSVPTLDWGAMSDRATALAEAEEDEWAALSHLARRQAADLYSDGASLAGLEHVYSSATMNGG